MIHIYPGLEVIDRHYKQEDVDGDFPGITIRKWVSRRGTVTRVDHPDRRKVYVKWEEDDVPEREAMLFWLEPVGNHQGLRALKNEVWYRSESDQDRPQLAKGVEYESQAREQSIPEIDAP